MDDNALPIKVMLHVILFIVFHARRVKRRPPKTATILASRVPRKSGAPITTLGVKNKTNHLNERRIHETRYPLSKPIAPSQKLQTKSCPPNQADEVDCRISFGAFRSKTANQNLRMRSLKQRSGGVLEQWDQTRNDESITPTLHHSSFALWMQHQGRRN